MPDDVERIHLTDPVAMRAYAHPLRLKLVGLLRMDGPHTATQAAKAVGDTVPNCSFHLRQLAKYGLVERIEGEDARERPWQATAMSTAWDDAAADPALRSASDHLTGIILSRYVENARRWLARREHEALEWRAVTGIADQTLHLTADEAADIEQRIDDVFAPYLGRQANPSLRPEGSRAINFIQVVMPWDVP